MNVSQHTIVGHEGVDWGSGSPLAGYNYYYDYAISLAITPSMNMNCTTIKQNDGNFMHIF